MNKQSSISTGLVVVVLILFVVTAAFITRLVIYPKRTSEVAPRKTRATNQTYTKIIALNQTPADGETPTETDQSGLEEQPIEEVENSEAQSQLSPTVAETEELLSPTNSPTDRLLAQDTSDKIEAPTETGAQIESDEAQLTPTPTTIVNLPEAGVVDQGLIIFLIAAFFIIFSFVY